jgi:hypothetical protein
MNKLHLEYLRDTGKHPTVDIIYELWWRGKVDAESYRYMTAYKEMFCKYTTEYVEWLENKVKAL